MRPDAAPSLEAASSASARSLPARRSLAPARPPPPPAGAGAHGRRRAGAGGYKWKMARGLVRDEQPAANRVVHAIGIDDAAVPSALERVDAWRHDGLLKTRASASPGSRSARGLRALATAAAVAAWAAAPGRRERQGRGDRELAASSGRRLPDAASSYPRHTSSPVESPPRVVGRVRVRRRAPPSCSLAPSRRPRLVGGIGLAGGPPCRPRRRRDDGEAAVVVARRRRFCSSSAASSARADRRRLSRRSADAASHSGLAPPPPPPRADAGVVERIGRHQILPADGEHHQRGGGRAAFRRRPPPSPPSSSSSSSSRGRGRERGLVL